MSGVLLGLPGPWAEDNREPSDHYTTKIGGLPDWPFPIEALDPKLLHCLQCGSKLCLVAQVYAPVSSPTLKTEERLLLVFGCLKPKCGSIPRSWRALRIQKVENDAKESTSANAEDKDPAAASPVSVSKSNWWDSLGVADDDDVDLEDLSKAFSRATSLTSQSKQTNSNQNSESTVTHSSPFTPQTRQADTDTPVIPCFYIYSQAEASSKDVASKRSNYSSHSIKEKESYIDDCGHEEKWAPEKYEYDRALCADRTYLKFKKQLDASPEQCFRYAFGGKPLLATAEVRDTGKCRLCGASKRFEMQLMPPLIYFLQEEAEASHKGVLEDWNWLTLVVYTCSKSCSKSCDKEKSKCGNWLVVEETVIVQSDKTLNELAQRYFAG
ncbi:hypothetical protein CCACVL1_26877 [Corchorus capsularis]|uniref:Programmed cell death protein 2 C-terminal domain-containing protein n=1 Tax=Corchorus capsularis TaxID=210143 RepID=A0A1R3GCY7_COCAP|nr:hypothetical protein CCACVL1_26877 [Corchorus capsularis]